VRELAAGQWHTLTTTSVNVFSKAIEEFAVAVQNGIQPTINGRDARRVLEIVLGIYRSAAEKCQVILSR